MSSCSIWGPRSYGAYQPMVAAGGIEIGDLILSNYDIALVGIAALVAVLSYWALKHTPLPAVSSPW